MIFATTPSLRDTSPQGETFELPLRGAVGNADCGVASQDVVVPSSTALISIIYDYHTTTPSLRDTSPQGEAFGLPLRGAVGNADCGAASQDVVVPSPTALISIKKGDQWSPLHTILFNISDCLVLCSPTN